MSYHDEEYSVVTPNTTNFVNIKFINAQQDLVTFKLNTCDPLVKAIDAYCEQVDTPKDTLRFFFGNERVTSTVTPASLEMADYDVIDVYQCQKGGGGGSEDGDEVKEKPKSLKLKVTDQSENVLEFNMKYTTPMKKMMNAYCQTKGVDVTSVRFFHDGIRLNFEDTAEGRDIDNEDTIQVFLNQQGGDGNGGDDEDAPEPPKEAPKEEKKTIEIVVKDQTGNEITFKVKPTTPLGKVRDAYCAKNEKDPKAIRFTFDGSRIQDTDTPASLDMEDGDVIDVFLEQIGGN